MPPRWSSRCFCRNCSPRACRATSSDPLALAFIFAVLASLLVAMTATPALCALLLRRHDARPEAGWLVRLKSWQRAAVHGVAAHFSRCSGGTDRFGHRGRCRAAVSGRHVHAGFSRGAFRHAGHQLRRPAPRSHEMLELGERISARSAGAALCEKHRAAGRAGRTGRGYLGTASQRVPCRAEARRQRRSAQRRKSSCATSWRTIPGCRARSSRSSAIASARA